MVFFEVHRRQPGIHLRGFEFHMTEHFRYILHRCPVSDKIRGEGMPQTVRGK